MKPKGKTIKTQTPEAVAALAPRTTVWDALDKVLKSSGTTHVSEVQNHIHEIAKDMRVIAEKKDSIAAHLRDVHKIVGGEHFAALANNVFPRLGISRSSAYRLLASGQLLAEVIPSPIIRMTLLERSDKPLTTADQTTGKVTLAPAFEKALKQIEMPKPDASGNYKPEDVDSYTEAVRAKAAELGKPKAKTAAQRRKDAHDAITAKFTEFMGKWGVPEAKALLLEFTALVETQEKTIAAVESPKPQATPAKKAS